jgi:tetratricopeptide (TPR) repeat protein
MGMYFKWLILTSITGSPLLSLAILVGAGWFASRYAFFAPSPLRLFWQWQRQGKLERDLENNPHDRPARFELAELYVKRGSFRRAVDMLRPNLERDDDDETYFLMGVACFGAGERDLAERLLTTIGEREPNFRQGAAYLELGRGKLAAGDAQGAVQAITRFLSLRVSSIEGRVLLARAKRKLGDEAGARALMAEAWRFYTSAPVYQRRLERRWAYRANPGRALLWAAVIIAAAILVLSLLPHLAPTTAGLGPMAPGAASYFN